MTPMELEATTEPRATQEHSKKCGVGGGSASEGFDCNICLDFAVDPVVTLCGHLYCWPCIYRWLRVDDGPNTQQCPVCKSSLSEKSLVPLYGRGRSTKRASQNAIGIPRRPSVPPDQISSLSAPQSPTTLDEGHHHHHHYTDLHPPAYRHHRHQHYHLPYDYVPSSPSSSPMGSSSVIHSTAGGVLGGMAIAVLPWVSRNQEEAAGMYYGGSSPYYVAAAGGGSPRLRRQEREVERSLNQIWVFLFCCALLCLLLF